MRDPSPNPGAELRTPPGSPAAVSNANRATLATSETVARCSNRTKLERAGHRQQHAHVAPRIVGRAIAQRNRNREISLRVVAQEKTYPAADRDKRNSVGVAKAGIPGDAAVDEAVELVAAHKSRIQFLVVTKLERTGHAVVAAGLRRRITSAERGTTEIELL